MKGKGIILGILLVLSILIGMIEPGHAGLNDGLIAYYPFNGDASDESGYGHHAAVLGAALTEDRFGNSNSAYDFEGGYIQIPDSPQLHFGSGDCSVSVWVISHDATGTQMIMYKDWMIRLNDYKNAGKIAFVTSDGGTSGDEHATVLASQVSAIDGNWHHLVAVRKGYMMLLYMDGILIKSITGPLRDMNTNNPITMGVLVRTGLEQGLSGALDDIRIYNRALLLSEIKQLYNEGRHEPVSGCISLDQSPMVSRLVILKQWAEDDQYTYTDKDGCYQFLDVVWGKAFNVIIKGPRVQ